MGNVLIYTQGTSLPVCSEVKMALELLPQGMLLEVKWTATLRIPLSVT